MTDIVLTTERLKLEIIDWSHFDDLCDLLANPKVQKYFPSTLNRAESEELYNKIQQRYQDDGYCFWAVIRREDNQFLGICGILKQIVDGQVEAEVGYRFLDSFWGQGYATEAAKGCMDYARDELGVDSVISLILPANEPSIRVAERNGLKWERETFIHGFVHGVYRVML